MSIFLYNFVRRLIKMPQKVRILKNILLFGLLAISSGVCAQAGATVYNSLNLPYSARHNALGGSNVSTSDGDLGMALNNPALLSQASDKLLSLNYAYYGASMNFASVLYGHNWGHNYSGYAIHYLDYGKFAYADEYGNLLGTTFSARDFLFEGMYARQLSHGFRIGAAIKGLYSSYESYSSFALGADVGAYYSIPDSTLQIGLSLQNIGWQLKGFYSDEYGQKLASLPLNLQLGLSYKLAHAPLRFSLTIHNMQTWNLSYVGIDEKQANHKSQDTWYNTLFSHTVWAVDIVPKKDVFWLTVSYNHRRRREMAIQDQFSLAGLAIGTGFHVKGVRIGAAFSQYTRGNFTFQTSISLQINELMK